MMLMAEILSDLGKITSLDLAQILFTLEEVCEKSGRSGEFVHLCDRLVASEAKGVTEKVYTECLLRRFC